MKNIEIFLIAAGLAMDAFAVSVAAASSGRISGKRAVFRLSFHFGLFQFFMPVIGWYSGTAVSDLVRAVDHWIAFILLAFVGGRMLYESFAAENNLKHPDPSKGLSLISLSVATSIDALAVGFSMAMIDVDIWYPSIVIGIITAGLSLLGIFLGKVLSDSFSSSMERIGGGLLILIGLKILLEHLFSLRLF
jgi:putative Mn2+ efflux pump MntP